jgi:hypothetical protein
MSLSQTSSGTMSNQAMLKAKNMQKRLLLVYHSINCRTKDGECQVSRHCATMKKVIRHIQSCTTPQCHFQHCRSTRELVDHLENCKLAPCPLCAPMKRQMHRELDRCKRRYDPSDHINLVKVRTTQTNSKYHVCMECDRDSEPMQPNLFSSKC